MLTVPFFFLYNDPMRLAALLGLGFLLAAATASAHHSYASEYDPHRAITLTGKVTRVEWMNPHIYFYVDIKDGGGKPIHYAVQGAAPNTLFRLGWRIDSLKPGDTITVVGWKARDGWNRMNARDVTLSDGRKVFAAVVDANPPN